MLPDRDREIAFWLNVVCLDIATIVIIVVGAGVPPAPWWAYTVLFVALLPFAYYIASTINYIRWRFDHLDED